MYSPATRHHLFFMSLFIIFNFSWMFLISSTGVFSVFFFFSKPNAYTTWHVHFLYGYQLTLSLGWTRVCALPGVVTLFQFCCNEFVNFLLWSMWKCVPDKLLVLTVLWQHFIPIYFFALSLRCSCWHQVLHRVVSPFVKRTWKRSKMNWCGSATSTIS